MLHFGQGRPAEVRLGAFGAPDTRFPFILFVSQAETEAVLSEHLHTRGVCVERGVELTDLRQSASGVLCRLRHADGHEEEVTTRYVAGCDGAHSSVRKLAAVAFEGDAYLQDFLLGDVEVEGAIEPNALHSFAGGGIAMFFPLRTPASWRVIALAGGAAQSVRPDGYVGFRCAGRDLSQTRLHLKTALRGDVG
ncbi:MAG TPA: FAD-dependent monooxygenase [Steroidobacteraceae bacterium]|nr:FAD-dependent monooxygenase [Steroidobacteraceae bacterium]